MNELIDLFIEQIFATVKYEREARYLKSGIVISFRGTLRLSEESEESEESVSD